MGHIGMCRCEGYGFQAGYSSIGYNKSEHLGGGYKVQFAGHLSQVIGLPKQKVSQTLVKANLRPKNFCSGLIRPKVSFYKCLG